jgi:agmatinase
MPFGARFGPRAIRNASSIYALRGVGYYDSDFDTIFLHGVRIVDCGDSDMIHYFSDKCLANIQADVEKIATRGVIPVVLGGDHAVTIPAVRGLKQKGPLHFIQFDAHLDFVDERFGVREGHGNVVRRVMEMDHVTGATQIGIRGPGSSDPSDFADAKRMGSTIIGAREVRRSDCASVLNKVPDGRKYYVTIDVDAFDAGLAPGSGSPSIGGLDYYHVIDLLHGIAAKGEVVGFDFVEVAPQYDQTEVTAQLAARVILDFLGAIFHEKRRSK